MNETTSFISDALEPASSEEVEEVEPAASPFEIEEVGAEPKKKPAKKPAKKAPKKPEEKAKLTPDVPVPNNDDLPEWLK
jgi:hypothetical protein